MKNPTDLKILKAIFKEYSKEYSSFSKLANQRLSKVYVPIDVDKIAKKLGTEGDIVFTRLYHHLSRKHSYLGDHGEHVKLFALELGSGSAREINCIHFPLMASVLADLQDQQGKYDRTNWLSIFAVIVAIIALFRR